MKGVVAGGGTSAAERQLSTVLVYKIPMATRTQPSVPKKWLAATHWYGHPLCVMRLPAMPYTVTLSHMDSAMVTARMPLLGLHSGHFLGLRRH